MCVQEAHKLAYCKGVYHLNFIPGHTSGRELTPADGPLHSACTHTHTHRCVHTLFFFKDREDPVKFSPQPTVEGRSKQSRLIEGWVRSAQPEAEALPKSLHTSDPPRANKTFTEKPGGVEAEGISRQGQRYK